MTAPTATLRVNLRTDILPSMGHVFRASRRAASNWVTVTPRHFQPVTVQQSDHARHIAGRNLPKGSYDLNQVSRPGRRRRTRQLAGNLASGHARPTGISALATALELAGSGWRLTSSESPSRLSPTRSVS
jgi:hypothetical protein